VCKIHKKWAKMENSAGKREERQNGGGERQSR